MAGTGIVDLPSPNHGPRPERAEVDLLLLHYTGMPSAEAALDRLRDPAAEVSAHYLVDEDGRVYRLVAEERRAWHAGVSSWAGRANVNDFSIGIELVNPGHEFGYRPFPDRQMHALADLARGICARHEISSRRILGHSDVAPARKRDPGELFDWAWLARQGLGLWPNRSGPGDGDPLPDSLRKAQDLLAGIGYAVPRRGQLDNVTRLVLEAFQRRFRQEKVDGILDAATFARIRAVAELFGD